MGLSRQYLRYVPAALFGLVGSAGGNAAMVAVGGERGRGVAVAACEHVFVWDARKGEKVRWESCSVLPPSEEGRAREGGSVRLQAAPQPSGKAPCSLVVKMQGQEFGFLCPGSCLIGRNCF